jgi:hypothetical protein
VWQLPREVASPTTDGVAHAIENHEYDATDEHDDAELPQKRDVSDETNQQW